MQTQSTPAVNAPHKHSIHSTGVLLFLGCVSGFSVISSTVSRNSSIKLGPETSPGSLPFAASDFDFLGAECESCICNSSSRNFACGTLGSSPVASLPKAWTIAGSRAAFKEKLSSSAVLASFADSSWCIAPPPKSKRRELCTRAVLVFSSYKSRIAKMMGVRCQVFAKRIAFVFSLLDEFDRRDPLDRISGSAADAAEELPSGRSWAPVPPPATASAR